jgi:hypothetical protein
MSTIPASAIVQVNPSVLSAGGSGLDLSGLCLDNGTRTPIGTVPSFPSAPAVGAYYGLASVHYANALIYFAGFQGSNIKPGALLFAQYNQNAVPAYIRGGATAALSLTALQVLSGTLIVTVEGVQKTSGAITLSAATSPANAATIITTAFGAYDGVTSAATTIATGTTTSVTGSITGYTLTVTAVGSGALVVGGVLSGTGVTTGTAITAQLTGTTGGIGTYTVSLNQTTTSTTITQSYGLMTVAAMSSGTLYVGSVISGGTTAAGTTITALGTGTGAAGTYITSGGAQTVSATTISSGPLTCTYDSVSGNFVLTGGTPGAAGTIGYCTGTLATALSMTSATGAALSQGAAPATPAAFMAGIVAQTTNWATFFTLFDPDNGYGNVNKQAFANWDGLQNSEFAYVAWDLDITPTQSNAATNSLGYILKNNSTSGTICVYDPNNTGLAAFTSGSIASIDFTQLNGRSTLAFKSQSGFTSTVSSQTVSSNLIANGYNFYGSYATANQGFQFFNPGQISGQFQWADSYVNQIWMNSAFQLVLMTLLTSVKSIPYNSQGYALIRAALSTVITQAGNFGVFQPGVQLSALQIAEVNTAAGTPIDAILFSQGYYLQILPATAQVRGARGSPPMTFWYMDGGSVQSMNLASVEAQ